MQSWGDGEDICAQTSFKGALHASRQHGWGQCPRWQASFQQTLAIFRPQHLHGCKDMADVEMELYAPREDKTAQRDRCGGRRLSVQGRSWLVAAQEEARLVLRVWSQCEFGVCAFQEMSDEEEDVEHYVEHVVEDVPHVGICSCPRSDISDVNHIRSRAIEIVSRVLVV
eukprot:1958869-Amphidinium_carterae.1